ncbi:bifunctional protein-serine/threonine kinase/phosphatase [Cellvibrio japonicus]|nr:bifunctional protein-serine/threonine kinase/phosphatase [Cellvibrio japonicus]QEI17613.1 bifunctional protein-serine/threonine kinase/phosphatase [Cellvibrio japonicus]QEI21188.1 bifunctional protein-serine/threonine kinase/phosphatase [Cellvibrio japonicus]
MDHLQSPLHISFAQKSDAGHKPENQDTVGARLPDGNLLTTKGIAIAIADGVSSSKAAREASQTAIAGFLNDYYATPDTWSTQQSAMRVIQALNSSLWGRSQNSIYGEGYLTTFSALILKGASAFIFHVGDTRVYRLRDQHLELLTRDHTQRIDKHTTHLSRAMGADPYLEVDMHSLELHAGDLFILTSDGIHEAMPPQELRQLAINQRNRLEVLVDQALQLALYHQSDDNLSIQAVSIENLGTAGQDDTLQVLSRLPFPPVLSPGQILDGLRIKKILHESTRSQVYLVEDDQKNLLAMKTPSELFLDDPAYIERFVMEAWIGARIHSPGVVRVMAAPESRSCLYYLTEYIPGPTLAQLLKERGILSIVDAVELIESLLRGIRAFHRKETLHQDLKPDNIVVGARGPVIVDFGSCWVASVQEAGAPIARDHILGTLDYSAPEYRYGATPGTASDQFSLAVLLYEMLTGKLPYGTGYSKAMDLKSFQRLAYIPAMKHNPLVPYWLDKALEKALSINPNHRYTALSEWLQDLKRPNPLWLTPRAQPLLERDPLKAWKVIAISGWICALVALLWRG